MGVNRRSKHSVFIKDDILRRVDERQKLGVWEFMQLFFPEKTNPKQFECACKLMKKLLEEKRIWSITFKKLFPGLEYNTLLSIVLPKLARFGLIKIVGQRGKGRSYVVELERGFSDRLFHFSLEWFRIYARCSDGCRG